MLNYNLDVVSSVEIRIYTLTGEEVFEKLYLFGGPGAQLGENTFEWDGRNDNGNLVLGGVYIVSVTVRATGENSKTKVALVK